MKRAKGEILSDGVFAFFLRPDADGILNRADENFAIADFPGASGLDDGFNGIIYKIVHDDDFDFDFGKKIHRVFAAAVNLRMPLLATETFYFADRHALDAEAGQSFLDLFQLERLDDGLDFFHLVAARSLATG